MHNLGDFLVFDTIIEGEKNLKEAYRIRDLMGGELYWNIANDDCVEISNKLNILKYQILKINKALEGVSIKVIESYLRIKKLECLDSSLNSSDNRYLGYYMLDNIELKYIQEFYNKNKIKNKKNEGI